MPEFLVTDLLYLAEGKEPDDPFATSIIFPDPHAANNHKNTLVAVEKENGAFLSVIYDTKEPKQPKTMTSDEWSRVKWVKKWPGSIPTGEQFIKGWKYEGIIHVQDEPECETHALFIRITQAS